MAEPGRSAGSFASRCRITALTSGDTVTPSDSKDGGLACTMRKAVATAVLAVNGRRPVSSSNMTIPSENRSLRPSSTPSPVACSGER